MQGGGFILHCGVAQCPVLPGRPHPGQEKPTLTSKAARRGRRKRRDFMGGLLPKKRSRWFPAQGALEGDAALVQHGDLFAQSQAQPRAALGPGPGFVHPVEGLGQVGEDLRGIPLPVSWTVRRHPRSVIWQDMEMVPWAPMAFPAVVDEVQHQGTKQVRFQQTQPRLPLGGEDNSLPRQSGGQVGGEVPQKIRRGGGNQGKGLVFRQIQLQELEGEPLQPLALGKNIVRGVGLLLWGESTPA